MTITAREAYHFVEHEKRQKRFPGLAGGDIDQVVSREPDPAFAVLMADEFQRLLGRLEDAVLQAIALWKMEGFTNHEIAERLSPVRPAGIRTVQRKVDLIRKMWQADAPR